MVHVGLGKADRVMSIRKLMLFCAISICCSCQTMTVQKGRVKAKVEKPQTLPCNIKNIDKCNGVNEVI